MTRPPFQMAIVAIFIAIAGLLAAVVVMSKASREAFLREGGPVEAVSAALYFVAAALLAWLGRSDLRRFVPEIIVLAALGAREMDLDDTLFTNGLMKPNQFVGDAVPVIEKLKSVIILAILIWATIIVAKQYIPGLWRKTRRGVVAAQAGALAIAVAVLAELFDTPTRKLEVFGMSLGPNANTNAAHFEESIELAIPLLLIVAICAGLTRADCHTTEMVQNE